MRGPVPLHVRQLLQHEIQQNPKDDTWLSHACLQQVPMTLSEVRQLIEVDRMCQVFLFESNFDQSCRQAGDPFLRCQPVFSTRWAV